jgi:hypothetical protein
MNNQLKRVTKGLKALLESSCVRTISFSNSTRNSLTQFHSLGNIYFHCKLNEGRKFWAGVPRLLTGSARLFDEPLFSEV